MEAHRCKAHKESSRVIICVVILSFGCCVSSVPIRSNLPGATTRDVASPAPENTSHVAAAAPHTWHMAEIVRQSEPAHLNSDGQSDLTENIPTTRPRETFYGERADPSTHSQQLEELPGAEPRDSLHDYLNPNYTMRDFMADNNIYLSSSAKPPSWTEGSGLEVGDLVWHEGSGAPPASDAANKTLERQQVRNENLAIKFMQQFGYVPQSDSTSGFIFTSESLRDSIKSVQKFGDLPQTGELDAQTLELMKSPRCGVPDVSPPPREGGPKGGLTTIAKQGLVLTSPDAELGSRRRPKRYVLGSGGWNKRSITYHVENHSSKLHTKDNVLRELHKAFEAWSSYARLNFTHVPERDADIIIYFAEYDHYDGYPFDGQGGTLAHAYYPYEFGHYGGDIHFDESEQWAINPKDEYSGLDFFTVAVHEIGHSLGLAHSYVRSSIMFPYYKGNSQHFALDHDDVMGMYELYIRRHLPGDEEYFNQHHGDATPMTSTTTTTTTPATQPPPPRTTTPARPDTDEGAQNDAGTDDYDRETESENEEDVWRKRQEEEEKRRRQEEEARREEERKWYEEEARRAEAETKKREEDRRAYEEEIRKKEEETWRQYQEELKRREEERRKSDERWRREEEERVRREEEERQRAYEEELRRYEEKIRRREQELARQNNGTSEAAASDGWLEADVTAAPDAPDVCNGSLDAVAKIRNELFMFKEEYMWRFQSRGLLRTGYPAPMRALFPGLPAWSQRIDAAYQRHNDSVVVFFVGKHFFELSGHQKQASARPLSDLGLPDYVTQLDAAFFWPKNGKVYFFRHEEYWRYDERLGRLDSGYPQPMRRWHGVPSFLDAAYTWDAAVSYFFKGDNFWEFDNMNVRPVDGYPRAIRDFWFQHC